MASPPEVNGLSLEDQQTIASHLMRDERVLWQGRPARGLRLRSSDAVAIPFTLMWCGFSMFWEYSVLNHHAPWFFALWGIPFVCVGIYIVIGRFFYDAYQRGRTLYAVTNQRILFLYPGRQGSSDSLLLTGLHQINLREKADGSGSIIFDGRVRPFFPGFNARNQKEVPAIEFIERVRDVHHVIQSAQIKRLSDR